MSEVTTRGDSQPAPESEQRGWRAGRPVEDPDKIKRWGFVSARPSEYLVHVRRGQVRTRSSGQGASCFKLPGDGVAIVPTSLQQLSFVADQVTFEKVGVEVTGLAVYRIAEPLIAWRVLNFSFPERAQQKLEQTLTAMFVGAARRLVANLSVDDCLRKRKEAIAGELLREVAPVASGRGRPDDEPVGVLGRGWGVVIDTIEIQEVRVMSSQLFAAMQAPYRSALDQAARQARAEAEREIAEREASCTRAVSEARIEAERAVEERRRSLVEASSESRRGEALREAETAREIAERKLLAEAAVQARRAEIEQREAEARSAEVVQRRRLEEAEAHAEVAAHAARAEALARRAELERVEQALALEKRRAEVEVSLVEGRAAAEVALAQARAQREVVEAQARLVIAEKLPQLAGAVGAKFGEVKLVQIGGPGVSAGPGGGDGAGFSGIVQGVAAVLELVRGVAEGTRQ